MSVLIEHDADANAQDNEVKTSLITGLTATLSTVSVHLILLSTVLMSEM